MSPLVARSLRQKKYHGEKRGWAGSCLEDDREYENFLLLAGTPSKVQEEGIRDAGSCFTISGVRGTQTPAGAGRELEELDG